LNRGWKGFIEGLTYLVAAQSLTFIDVGMDNVVHRSDGSGMT
jgi:hypothetical protein